MIKAFDSEFAEALLGCKLLVGITYLDHSSAVKSQDQFYGIVDSVDEKIGIKISLQGSRSGETYTLPPDTQGIKHAPAGEYQLRATQEIVVNPDYFCSWSITTDE